MKPLSAPRWWIFYVDGDDWMHDADPSGRDFEWWTCHIETRAGDCGLVYAKAPVSALVAVLQATGDSHPQPNRFSHHRYAFPVRCAKVFKKPLRLSEMRNDGELSEAWPLIQRVAPGDSCCGWAFRRLPMFNDPVSTKHQTWRRLHDRP